MAQAWSPEFNPMTDEISTTPVWVRISNVPFTFYHRQILMGMVVGLGKPLRVDGTTLQFERARFARICIEVDLKKPLKGSILINGERSYVSYEGLNNICSTCGVYGHLVTACPQTVAESMEQVNITVQPSESTGGVQGDDGFTVVRRSNRRAGGPTNKNAVNVSQVGNVLKRNTRVNAPIPDHGNVAVFSGLIADLTEKENNGEMEISGANKENERVEIVLGDGKSGDQVKERFNFGKGSLVQDTNKGGVAEKKSFGPRTGRGNRPKLKGPSQARPVRGPQSGGKDMILPGKRLRVETEDAGRAGGLFSSLKVVSSEGRIPLQDIEENSNTIRMELNPVEVARDPSSHGSLMEAREQIGEQ